MKRVKLFPKIFLYTFLVMMFVTVLAHVLLYIFAPQMTLSTNNFLESGAIIESSMNTETLIKLAILKALPISLVGCIGISLGCSLLFSKAITKPIQQISTATEQMAKLNKEAKCQIYSQDEIGLLAMNVNTLYTNLLATIESLKEETQKVSEAERSKLDFLRAASHELKTPVTALNAILENMILGVGKYKDRDTYLLQCKDITTQLSAMIKEVLDTSKIDFATERQNAEIFDLSEELPKFCEPYGLIAKTKQVSFSLNIEQPCPVFFPKKSIEKILSNLLSNAVSYTTSGHNIWVTLQSDKLIIENECEPITQEKLSRLFEPFYRPDFARDRKDGGNGLGLYIVDTLCKALDLKYAFISTTSPKGMRFTLYF